LKPDSGPSIAETHDNRGLGTRRMDYLRVVD